MTGNSRFCTLTAALGLCLASGLANSAPVELITNGGFEAGLTSWTVTDQAGGSGTWFAQTGTTTPLSGTPTVGPAGGVLYAVTDQGGPGAHVLEQSFTVPVGATSVMLGFLMFVNDSSGAGPIANPAGLDYTANPNQHARVDILTATAGSFSIAAADVVANVVAPTVDAGAIPNPYTAYSFDLSAILTPGTTYRLRFGEVDNQLFLNQGVDNVSLLADIGTAQVPEPATLALVSLALAGMGISRRRSRG